MTIGTGFFGRSSLTENLQPRHLHAVDAARLRDDGEPFGDFSRARAVVGAARARRRAGAAGAGGRRRGARPLARRLRALILDELRELVRR